MVYSLITSGMEESAVKLLREVSLAWGGAEVIYGLCAETQYVCPSPHMVNLYGMGVWT